MRRRVGVSVGLIGIGTALLLVTTGAITVGALMVPMIVIVVGIVFLWQAFRPDGAEGNVFAGTFLSLSGVFLLLREMALPAVELGMVWPVFMTFGGAAFIAYGMKKGSDARHNLTVPGIAIVLLSGVFLLFSLDVVERSLAQVAVQWWPALVIGVGAALLWLGGGSDDDG